MVKTVQSSNWVRMVDWMRSSVSRSIAAVASSRIRILDFLRRARAKHTSCLWPTLKTRAAFQKQLWWLWWSLLWLSELTFDNSAYLRFSPPSEHSSSNFAGLLLTNLSRWECRRAFHTSSSLYVSKGSRFILREPENSTGSCSREDMKTIRHKSPTHFSNQNWALLPLSWEWPDSLVHQW